MIEVNDNIIMEEVNDILLELSKQLSLQGIKRFEKVIISGDNIQTQCPFHKDGQERKPSFGILSKRKGSDAAGTCHCFGCGWTGSFQEMISNCFGYDDFGIFGTKWLVKNFLTVSVENRPELELGFERKPEIKKDRVKYVSEEELDSYRYYHPYMYKRKMTDEVIDLFDIGYDKKAECITFPVRDINGNTVFVARRSVNTKYFNYPMNAEKPVYGLYEYEQLAKRNGGFHQTEVIICESMIDCLTLWSWGYVAVALNGLGNDLQFKQLNSMPCRKFILATDMDEAGLKARERIKKNLRRKIVTEYVWDINVAKDINDMTKGYFENLKETM